MKKIVLLVAFVSIISSCRSTKLTVVSDPRDSFNYPLFKESTASFEEVWAKLIDIIAINGYTIERLDKENGIFISGVFNISLYSIADDNGRITDNSAFIITPKIRFQAIKGRKVLSTKIIHPDSLYFFLNVRIRQNGSNGTIINVNIPKIRIGGGHFSQRQLTTTFPIDTITVVTPIGVNSDYWSTTKSTGVLENYIIDAIKDGDLKKYGELKR